MTYSWYNICEESKNNGICYHDCTGFKEIIFDDSNYRYKDINDYIIESIGADSIGIEFDLVSFRCLITIETPFSLDLRGSNFGSLIGFGDYVYREDSWGRKLPYINDSVDSLFVHCDIAGYSLVDGQYGDAIYVIDTTSLTRDYPFSAEPLRIGYSEMKRTIINSIEIRITDPLGKIIGLNSIDTSFILTLK